MRRRSKGRSPSSRLRRRSKGRSPSNRLRRRSRTPTHTTSKKSRSMRRGVKGVYRGEKNLYKARELVKEDGMKLGEVDEQLRYELSPVVRDAIRDDVHALDFVTRTKEIPDDIRESIYHFTPLVIEGDDELAKKDLEAGLQNFIHPQLANAIRFYISKERLLQSSDAKKELLAICKKPVSDAEYNVFDMLEFLPSLKEDEDFKNQLKQCHESWHDE